MSDDRAYSKRNAALHALSSGIVYSHLMSTIKDSGTSVAHWESVTSRNAFLIDTPWCMRTQLLFRMTELIMLACPYTSTWTNVMRRVFKYIQKSQGVDKEAMVFAAFGIAVMRIVADDLEFSLLLELIDNLEGSKKHGYLNFGDLRRYVWLTYELASTGWVTLDDLLDYGSGSLIVQRVVEPTFWNGKSEDYTKHVAKSPHEFVSLALATVAKGYRPGAKKFMQGMIDHKNNDWLSVLVYPMLMSEQMCPITSRQLIRVLPSAKMLTFLEIFDQMDDFVENAGII